MFAGNIWIRNNMIRLLKASLLKIRNYIYVFGIKQIEIATLHINMQMVEGPSSIIL